MNAPVTSVARLSKKVFAPGEDPDMPSKPDSTDTPTMPTKPDAPTEPDKPDTPVVDDVSKALVLTFNANGGTLDDDATTKDIILKTDSDGNVTVTLSQTAEREGYTFTGWNTSPDGSGTPYPNGSVINQNDFNGSKTLTLYAQWENSNPTTNPDNPERRPKKKLPQSMRASRFTEL